MVLEMPKNDRSASARIHLGTIVHLRDFAEVLNDLNRAYNAIYLFFDIAGDVEDLASRWGDNWPGLALPALLRPRRTPAQGRRGRAALLVETTEWADPSSYVDPRERLAIRACRIGSPGILDIVGNFNILDTLRRWQQDRHERRKDRDYREQAERDKLWLENELLRDRVIESRIALLEKLNTPKTEINWAVNRLLVDEVAPLQRRLDSGDIQGIETRSQAGADRDGSEDK